MVVPSPGKQPAVPAFALLAFALLLGGVGASMTPAVDQVDANVLSCSAQPCCSVPCVDIGYAGPEMAALPLNGVPTVCSVVPGAPCSLAALCDVEATARALDPTLPQTLDCPGPLVNVWVGDDLSCQVNRRGDNLWQVYPPSTKPGDCATFVWDGATLYAANFGARGSASGSIGARTPFQPVSQSVEYDSLGGLGGMPQPPADAVVNTATTEVLLPGNSDLSITQVDEYVSGEDWFTTEITVHNAGSTTRSIIVYRALDCYLGGADTGYGFLDAQHPGAIGCSKNPDNSPPGRVEQLIPLTPGSHYFESFYGTVWSWIGSHQPFPDTCLCPSFIDNGIGISWNIDIPAGESVSVASKLLFSIEYIPPPDPPQMPPSANFKHETIEVDCGAQPIQFTDLSNPGSSTIVAWAWDFGDGTGSSERNPEHTYARPGTYNVVETVWDSNGTSSQITFVVEATEGKACQLPGKTQDDPQVQRPPRDGVDDEIASADVDQDNVADRFDNCPGTPNTAQKDLDGDERGDACDSDRDDDSIPNDVDNCADVANKGQADLEGDGIGDACDTDWDNDGALNADDNCPHHANTGQDDGDADGLGDACDIVAQDAKRSAAAVVAGRDQAAGAQAGDQGGMPWVPALIGAAAFIAAAVLVGVVVARRK